jgi:hypothetical protein
VTKNPTSPQKSIRLPGAFTVVPHFTLTGHAIETSWGGFRRVKAVAYAKSNFNVHASRGEVVLI